MTDKKITGVILLEGPDAAGKSTLAEAFKHIAGPDTEIIHLTWSPKLETVMVPYNIGMLAHADELAKDRLVIIDRQCLSSYVYQDVFRPKNRQNNPDMYAQFRQYCPNASIIFCLPSFPVWKQNFLDMCASREEMYGADKVDQMVEIYRHYEEMAYGKVSPTCAQTWYPDSLLMEHIALGGITKMVPSTGVYDFTANHDQTGESWANGFLMQHQAHQ